MAILKPAPDIRVADYEGNKQHLEELDLLAQRLNKDMSDEQIDAKTVASFQSGLIAFQERVLGPSSMPPHPFPKLPFHLITDTDPYGSLYDIVAKSYQLKDSMSVSALEWDKATERMKLIRLLEKVRDALARNGYMVSPTVYFHPSLGAEAIAELTAHVRAMKGKVVDSDNAVGLTHIVHPFGPKGDPDDGEEYMRTQRKRGKGALVHRWYTPDSHNEWLDATVAPEEVQNDQEYLLKEGPIKVYVRWIQDSKRYNEWMNNVDYLTEEAQKDYDAFNEDLSRKGITAAQYLARKRKAPDAAGRANKVHVADGTMQEVDPNFRQEVSEGVTRRYVLHAPRRVKEGVVNSENLSFGQMRKHIEGSDVASTMQRVQADAPEGRAARGPEVDPASEQPVLEAAATSFTLPVYAHWFRFDAVHEIERNANIEFFNGSSASKTEALYREYRDFLIREYRRNPQRKLLFFDARKYLVGDVNSIYRVWNFLNSWGLINFEALPQRHRDEPIEVITVDAAGNPTSGEVRLVGVPNKDVLAPSAAAAFKAPVATPATAAKVAAAPAEAKATVCGHTVTTVSRKEAAANALAASQGGRLEFYCNAMPWVKCTELRYHCTKFPDIDLCPPAFAEGRFPPGTCAKDFVKIDTTSAVPEHDGWSEQELLLLLEGLELFGDDWARVSAHVGTKNQMECMLHFLQLPIEEDIVAELEAHKGVSSDDVHGGRAASQGATRDSAATLSENPFEGLRNPLMAQLAFLAEIVSPQVAAAAASAALTELFRGSGAANGDTNGAANGKSNGAHASNGAAAAPAAAVQVENARPEDGAPADAAAAPAATANAHEVREAGAEPMQTDPPAGPSSGQAAAGAAAGDVAASAAAPAPAARNGSAQQASADVAVVPEASGLSAEEIRGRVSDVRLKAATAAAFAGAAVKARLLAEAEEARMADLAMNAIEALTEKLKLKMSYLGNLEAAMQTAHGKLVEARVAAIAERDSLAQQRRQLQQQQAMLAQLTQAHQARTATPGAPPGATVPPQSSTPSIDGLQTALDRRGSTTGIPAVSHVTQQHSNAPAALSQAAQRIMGSHAQKPTQSLPTTSAPQHAAAAPPSSPGAPAQAQPVSQPAALAQGTAPSQPSAGQVTPQAGPPATSTACAAPAAQPAATTAAPAAPGNASGPPAESTGSQQP